MYSTRWMICCLIAFGVTVSYSRLGAQDAADLILEAVPAHDHDHDHVHPHAHLHDQHEQIREHQKARFQQHLALRITELKRVCDLDEKQVKKLNVASKGAVEEAMKLFLQRFPQLKGQAQNAPAIDLPVAVPARPLQAGLRELRVAVIEQAVAEPQINEAPVEEPELGDNLPPAVPPPAAPALAGDVIVAPQLMPAAAPIVWNAHQNFQMEPSEAATTIVWRNAVQHTLADEQKETYRTAQTDRRLFKRKTVVDRVIASVDRRLFLSDQQRKELAKVIHETVGDNLDNMVPHGGFTSDAMVAAQVVAQIHKNKLKDVLDPAQIESWNDVQHAHNGIVFGFGIQR